MRGQSGVCGEGVVFRVRRVVGGRQLGVDEGAGDAVERRLVTRALEVLPQRRLPRRGVPVDIIFINKV